MKIRKTVEEKGKKIMITEKIKSNKKEADFANDKTKHERRSKKENKKKTKRYATERGERERSK